MQRKVLCYKKEKHRKTEKKLDYIKKTCIINEKAYYKDGSGVIPANDGRSDRCRT